MTSKHFCWFVTLLVSLIGGGVLAGCGEEGSWEHPNRQRYAAPPEETDDTRSVEELQRAWKEQDRQKQARQEPVQQEPVQQEQVQQEQVARAQSRTDGQEANRDSLDMALDYLEAALEAMVTNAGGDRTVTDGPNALGGGPPPDNAPPANNGSGEM